MLVLLLLLVAAASGQDVDCGCKSCMVVEGETLYAAEEVQGDRCGQGCLMVKGNDEICVCSAPINVPGGRIASADMCTRKDEDDSLWDNKDLFHGDMVLTDEQKHAIQILSIFNSSSHSSSNGTGSLDNAMRSITDHWPDRKLKYEFDSRLTEDEKTAIRGALAILNEELDGCFEFEESDTGNRIKVENAWRGSWSPVGYSSPLISPINLTPRHSLSPKYQIANIQHEFLHAVGLWHHHSRSDRDEHVTILAENIIPGTEMLNFEKVNPALADHFGLPYDYTSVMHYWDTAFGRNGRITIQTTNSAYQSIIGTVEVASDLDIELVKRMHGCDA